MAYTSGGPGGWKDGFFTNMQALLDTSINTFIQSVSTGLITMLQPLLLTALTIYFMCKAWSIMYGTSQDSLRQVTMQFIKMAFITAMFCNSLYFFDNIATTLYKLDETFVPMVSSAFSSTTSTSEKQTAFTMLDKMYHQIVDDAAAQESQIMAGSSEDPNSGMFDVMPNFSAIVMTFVLIAGYVLLGACTIFATFTAFLILITNTIGLCFILAFGPLFGSLLLFPQTKDLFTGWLKACLTFVLTKIFVAAAIVLMYTIIKQTLGLDNSSPDMEYYSDVIGSGQTDYGEIIYGPASIVFDLLIKLVFVSILILMFSSFIKTIPSMSTQIVGGMQMGDGGQGATGEALSKFSKVLSLVPGAGGIAAKLGKAAVKLGAKGAEAGAQTAKAVSGGGAAANGAKRSSHLINALKSFLH